MAVEFGVFVAFPTILNGCLTSQRHLEFCRREVRRLAATIHLLSYRIIIKVIKEVS
jgi:hypothetical protein